MILTALAMVALAPQTFNLIPTDDLWVYAHSADPGKDTTMRIWGLDGQAAPSSASDADNFGLGYLKWTLVGTPVGGKLKEAKLIVTNVPKPPFTVDQAKAAPLEARPLGATFSEATWKKESIDSLLPKAGKDDAYGTGYPESVDGDTVTITIDLLKGKGGFADAIAKAQADGKKEIAIALTSTLSPADAQGQMYKVYTKEERDEKVRPKLVLTFE